MKAETVEIFFYVESTSTRKAIEVEVTNHFKIKQDIPKIKLLQ